MELRKLGRTVARSIPFPVVHRVRSYSIVLAAWLALLLGAGCRDRDGALLPAETDEPLFVQGMQLKKLDRNAEALNAFLKVIEKRGERAAA